MMLTYLVEITVYDPSIASTQTLYFSTHGFTSKPVDATPWGSARNSIHYEAKLKQPALMRRDVFSQGTTGGASTTGYGIIELINDGSLDYLADCGFSGRTFCVMLGDVSAALSTFSLVLKGTMEQPSFDWSSLSIRIRDRLAELDRPFQTNLYLGDNVNPSGLEGYPDDIKGTPKPRVYGKVFNVTPPQVNNVRLIYQVNDGALSSIDAVYDQGVSLVAGATYSSQADMESNAPMAGQFRAWLSGGYFRIGASPIGPVTADVTQGSTAAARTTAQILKNIAIDSGFITSGDINATDVAAMDAANASVIGIWINQGDNTKQVMDAVAASIGAWYGFDRNGKLRMAQLSAPSGVPVATFTSQEIISLQRTATADTDRGVPAYQVKLSYGRNWTIQNSGLASSVSSARKAWLDEEYRKAIATDNSILAIHLLAPSLEMQTLLTDESAASAESSRRLAIYKVRRDRINLRVRASTDTVAQIDLGAIVSIQINRFGYNSGKLFRVIGLQPDLSINAIDLTLWG